MQEYSMQNVTNIIHNIGGVSEGKWCKIKHSEPLLLPYFHLKKSQFYGSTSPFNKHLKIVRSISMQTHWADMSPLSK
jgi:hypothetical protein